MSHRVRQLLPLAVLAATLVAGAPRVVAGPEGPQPPRRFERFPAHVVGRAPALPAYAASAHDRIRQQLHSANAMWATAFKAAGSRYRSPTLVAASRDCGAPPPGWAGLYCPAGETILIDTAGHVARHGIVGQALEDTVLGYVVAHEVGHHVQTLRGAPGRSTGTVRLRRELHANCLAGVWGKAAGRPLPPMWFYGEDAEHGTVAQQVRWLNAGYRSARPADCDAIWSASTSP
jgi:predicted metalloprotease